MMTQFKSFLAGFTSPSTRALLTGCMVVCLFLIYNVSSGETLTLRAIELYYANSPVGKQKEDPLHLTLELLSLKRQANPDDAHIVFLGASTNRESIYSKQFLEDKLEDMTSISWQLIDLTSGGQTLMESLLIVESLPLGDRDIVLIGVNPLRFNTSYSRLRQRFAYPEFGVEIDGWYEVASELGVDEPGPVSSLLLPRSSFTLMLYRFLRVSLLRQLGVNIGLIDDRQDNERTNTRHYYSGDKIQNASTWNSVIEESRQTLADPDNARTLIREQLVRSATHLHTRGVRLFFVESPLNPRFVKEAITVAGYREFNEDLQTLAKESSASYLLVNEQSELEDRHFYDWGHLRADDARRRYTEVLIQNLSAELLANGTLQ